jgi:hypothetical protein
MLERHIAFPASIAFAVLSLSIPVNAQATCPSCQGCNVTPIVRSASVGPLPPGVNFPHVQVSTFDPSLGVLTGARFTVSIETVNRRFRFENLDALSPCAGSTNNPDYFSDIAVGVNSPTDGSTIAMIGAMQTHVDGAIPPTFAFDGCQDFGLCVPEPPSPAECCPGCPIPQGTGPNGGACAPGVTTPQRSGYHRTFADQAFPFTTSCFTSNLGVLIGMPGSTVDVPVSAVTINNTGSIPCSNTTASWNASVKVTVTITYTYCPSAGPGFCPFCFGDNTSPVPCPCNNTGQPGHGCQNSASTGGAMLGATGTTSPDTVVLTSSGELPNAPSIFLQGNALLAQPVAFGDGLRCIGGALKRLYVKLASGGAVSAPGTGDASISARSAALGDPIAPGSPRSYQVYYRDPNLAFCPSPSGNSWNVSSAITVIW